MTRDDLIFDINYSYNIEKMYFTILSRIDKTITMVLIILGFSVFAPYMNFFTFGVIVAVLSVLQLVNQYGQAAGISREQARQYRKLLVEMDNLSDSDLQERHMKIQDADTDPWQSLKGAAFKRTCIILDRKCSITLTRWQKFIALLAGDLP